MRPQNEKGHKMRYGIKENYLSPRTRFIDLKVLERRLLCASGEKYKLPQGIGIADYSIEDSDDNDW